MEDRYNFLQIKGRVIYNRLTPYPGLDYRHGTMSALCLYVLGRYFDKDYPSPVWKQSMRGPEMVFASLHDTAWIEGDENDDWGWHNTFIAPILTYMLLTGDRVPAENGVLKEVMRAQEVMVSGRKGDRALATASVGYLHQAAYLLQDGRYAHFREMSGVDTSAFRLGQSFWPEEHLRAGFPADLIGRWTVWGLPETHWRARGNGYRLEESFYGASFRSTGDGGGDFILLDGYNGDGRNPYHCFATVDLRIGGFTLLEGYRNQVWTLADGLAEPAIPRDTALRFRDVIGQTAVFVGEVPRAPYSRWQRSIAQRTGKYALFVDDLTYRAGGEYRDVQVLWETAKSLRSVIPAPGMLRLENNPILVRYLPVGSAGYGLFGEGHVHHAVPRSGEGRATGYPFFRVRAQSRRFPDESSLRAAGVECRGAWAARSCAGGCRRARRRRWRTRRSRHGPHLRQEHDEIRRRKPVRLGLSRRCRLGFPDGTNVSDGDEKRRDPVRRRLRSAGGHEWPSPRRATEKRRPRSFP